MNHFSLAIGAFAALVVGSAACAQSSWVNYPQMPDPVTLTLPAARTGQVMVAISPTRLFVHGGQTSNTLNATTCKSDAWIYDAMTATWDELLPTGSAPQRTTHMAAYDSARNKVVVFGGANSSGTATNTIYEYDVATNAWAGPVTVMGTAPTVRYAGAFTYDPIGNRCILQGGNRTPFPNCKGDCVQYRIDPVNGPTWTTLVPDAGVPNAGGIPGDPGLRWVHRMVYDSARTRIVLYGGSYRLSMAAAAVSLFDTWEFQCDPAAANYNTWVRVVTPAAPANANWFGLAYDSNRHRTVLFGGNNVSGVPNTPSSEVAEYDGATWTVRAPGGPAWQNQYNDGCYLSGVGLCFSFSGSQVSGQAPRTPASLIAPATLDAYGPNSPATALVYGVACNTSVGTPALSASNLAWIAADGSALDDYGIELSGAPVGAPCSFLLGVDTPAIPLDIIGMTGCSLLVTPVVASVAATADGLGRASFATPIAGDPAMVGNSFSAQAAIVDFALATPLKVATSNGVRHTFGGI